MQIAQYNHYYYLLMSFYNINKTRSSYEWVEIHFQKLRFVRMWLVLRDNELFGPIIPPHTSSERHYLDFFINEPLALLEDVSVAT